MIADTGFPLKDVRLRDEDLEIDTIDQGVLGERKAIPLATSPVLPPSISGIRMLRFWHSLTEGGGGSSSVDGVFSYCVWHWLANGKG